MPSIDGFPGVEEFWSFANLVSLAEVLFWVGGAVLVIVFVKSKAWPWLSAFVKAVDAWMAMPARMDSQDRVLESQNKVLERVRAQVENSHTTNLREENDARHAELVEALGTVQGDVQTLNARDLAHTQVHIRIEDRLDKIVEQVTSQRG